MAGAQRSGLASFDLGLGFGALVQYWRAVLLRNRYHSLPGYSTGEIPEGSRDSKEDPSTNSAGWYLSKAATACPIAYNAMFVPTGSLLKSTALASSSRLEST
ncbi:hypothetical protein VM1G_09405 [Cytospora mali]|uniref:Uncharacterized protein n=1 Tax=Cytospora mali TaxID=578113 RepID=A0A194WCS0_CYTMA|nr:hypothetical protein VM1G_09405 [Valsa mali]